MKSTCDAKEFSKACQIVSKAVAKGTSIPALEGIKIEAVENGIVLTGYNLETGISTVIRPTSIMKTGIAVIDAKTICKIAKKLPKSCATISCDNSNIVSISSENSNFSIAGLSPDEYPELPKPDEKSNNFEISQPALKDMIRQTVYAVAQADAKPIHTGVQFTVSEGLLTMAAVDGYRLAICKEPIEYSGKPSFDFVIPGKTLTEILDILSDNSDAFASISVSRRHATISIEDVTVYTRLLEGEFLDWKTVIPQKCSTAVKVDACAFLSCIERAAVVGSTTVRSPLRCKFSGEQGGISIALSTAIGTASDFAPADISGDEIEIGFNSKYISDALSHSYCDEVRLELSTPLSPMVVKPDSGDSFLFLVLPVRMQSSSEGTE